MRAAFEVRLSLAEMSEAILDYLRKTTPENVPEWATGEAECQDSMPYLSWVLCDDDEEEAS